MDNMNTVTNYKGMWYEDWCEKDHSDVHFLQWMKIYTDQQRRELECAAEPSLMATCLVHQNSHYYVGKLVQRHIPDAVRISKPWLSNWWKFSGGTLFSTRDMTAGNSCVWASRNYGRIFRCLWTKVHQINYACMGTMVPFSGCRWLVAFQWFHDHALPIESEILGDIFPRMGGISKH